MPLCNPPVALGDLGLKPGLYLGDHVIRGGLASAAVFDGLGEGGVFGLELVEAAGGDVEPGAECVLAD